LPFSVILFLLSRWSGGLLDRIGARAPLVAGPLLAGLGMLLFAVPGVGGSYWVTFFPPVAILGLGMALTAAPLTATVLGAVNPDHTGIASGVNNAVSRVGGLLAIALLGIIMLQVFTAALQNRLAELQPLPGIAAGMLDSRTQLAAMTVPSGVDSETASALRAAIAESFVTGFRRVMLACALMAAGSAAIAAVALSGRRAGRKAGGGGSGRPHRV
jgi:hypothetical protein